MKRSLKLAGAGVVVLGVAALAVPYLQITGGRIKWCGADEIVYCGGLGGPDCRIKVTVASCQPNGSGISVNKPDLHMCTPQRKIVWRLATDGYKFAEDGIAFKVANTEFDGKQWSDDRYVWRNLHTRPVSDDQPAVAWEYQVHILKSSDGSECGKLDPFVYNE